MGKDAQIAADALILRLKRRNVVGSFNCAKETLNLLRTIVSSTRWANVQTLLQSIKEIGARLVQAQPTELAVGNIVRRVLHLIKEEFTVAVQEDPSIPDDLKPTDATSSSMYNLLGGLSLHTTDYTIGLHTHALKSSIIQAIQELLDELESLYTNIGNQAIEHIHSNEMIMTLGKSKTVFEFLLAAHRKRKFQVIVAEASPSYSGQAFAVQLAKAGIETTVISDSAIYAVMSRVNKVILGTHAVLANGGLIAQCGSHMMAAAAKFHHTPVVVCTGLYKLSPLQPCDIDKFTLCVNPDPVLKFEEDCLDGCNVVNPYFDYVGPEYISLYLTNVGGHSPSYIYRLLSENYDPRDTRLVVASGTAKEDNLSVLNRSREHSRHGSNTSTIVSAAPTTRPKPLTTVRDDDEDQNE